MLQVEIKTMAGVESIDGPAGEVRVLHGAGDTVVKLEVEDGDGIAVAFLNRDTLVDLVLALGAAGQKL